MVGVGTTGEPQLRPGIHLRWATVADLGFPPYGFGLFRKRSKRSPEECLQDHLRGQPLGRHMGYRLTAAPFEVYSHLPLELVDVYPVGGDGIPEIGLSGRRWLAADLAASAKRVKMTAFMTADDRVTAIARWRGVEVDRAEAVGCAGSLATLELRFDSIDSVQIGRSEAVLVDLCAEPLFPEAFRDWSRVPGFTYPLGLPLTHPDYPATGRAAEDVPAYRARALARIVTPGAPSVTNAQIDEAYADLKPLVLAGATPQAERYRAVTGVPQPADAEMQDNSPELRIYHLQAAMLASLRPEAAQMLGLYWRDDTAVPGEFYDYLILGFWSDPDKGLDPKQDVLVIDPKRLKDLGDARGYVVTELSLAAPVTRPPPGDVRAYYVPGLTARQADGSLKDWRNNVGLRWEIPRSNGRLMPSEPVLYDVVRASLGSGTGPDDPASASYGSHLTSANPVLITWPPADQPRTVPPGWPQSPIQYLDRGLDDGWYAYRVAGIDVFGRRSGDSDPSDWWDADPEALHHPGAILVHDTMPPPPPAMVEAQALQADAPFLQTADAAMVMANLAQAERDAGQAALRVSWLWPDDFKRDAIDMDPGGEFRLYFQPGLLNASGGRIEAVTDLGATSTVTFFEGIARPADYFVDGVLRSGVEQFQVTASTANAAGVATTLTVGNVDVALPVHKAPHRGGASVFFPPGHPSAVDYENAASWDQQFATVAYDPTATRYELRVPDAPPAASRWLVPLSPTEEEPIVYGAVGVTAVDSHGNESGVAAPPRVAMLHRKPPAPPTLPPDSPRVWASRPDYYGNSYYDFRFDCQEHLRYVVCRALDGSLYRADFDVYTARRTVAGSGSVFAQAGYTGVWPSELSSAQRSAVQSELTALWTSLDPLRAALAAIPETQPEARAVQMESVLSLYRGLSNNAMRVLACLPDVGSAFSRLGAAPLDPADVDPDGDGVARYRDQLKGRGTNVYFYRARSIDAASNLGPLGLSSPPVYLPEEEPPEQPRIFKGLGGDRQAALTWAPDPAGRAESYDVYRGASAEDARDVRLMGSPVRTVPGVPLVARGGTVSLGGATGVATVERVYDASGWHRDADPLSGQTAASYLSTPAAPVAGAVPGVTAADGTTVVVVYRDSHGALQVTPVAGAALGFVDAELAGPATYFYRLVAARSGDGPDGQVLVRSRPSDAAPIRVVDLTAPDPPAITTIERVRVDAGGGVHPWTSPPPAGETWAAAIHLEWTSPDPHLSCLVQYQPPAADPGTFANASAWLRRGAFSYVHLNPAAAGAQAYRLKVLNQAGNANTVFAPASLAVGP